MAIPSSIKFPFPIVVFLFLSGCLIFNQTNQQKKNAIWRWWSRFCDEQQAQKKLAQLHLHFSAYVHLGKSFLFFYAPFVSKKNLTCCIQHTKKQNLYVYIEYCENMRCPIFSISPFTLPFISKEMMKHLMYM